MRRRAAKECRVVATRPRRDRGTTFVEALVTIVLLGVTAIATMTALRTSIVGSDQHKSKVAALAELEGAAAYLARESTDEDCADEPPPGVGDFEAILGSRPGDPNAQVTLTIESVDCGTGLPVVSLRAAHDRGNALEELDVVVGGISVIKNGDGLVDPPPGPCAWGEASALPVTVNKVGSNLAFPVTIKITYTDECDPSTMTASAYLENPGAPPRNTTVTLLDQGGLFEGTLGTSVVNWRRDVVNVTITTTGPNGTFTTSFTVT